MRSRLLLCLAVAFPSSLLAAVEVAREGTYDATDCMGGPAQVITQSASQVIGSFDVMGTLIGKPGMLYHNTNIRCLGVWSLIDGQYSESGNCQIVDADGDKMLGRFSRGTGDGRWEVISGSGKYVGLTSNGTYAPLGPFPQPTPNTVQGCSRVTGTWKMR